MELEDLFTSLEKRITDVVDRYTQLKEEKRLLEEDLREKGLKLNSMEEKCRQFEMERDMIRAKIDSLLERLKTLAS